jgi:uroporphyrin-III C-methyltransferase / precorrin-2 dehydrogenase / sirohydrochlorin ferrochelatase
MKNADSKPDAPDFRTGGPGRVSLVGAGPGDPDLWTVRAARLVREADLVLYDALVDAVSLRGLTDAPCFHVGKRAGRTSVKQETIHKLMIRAARHGKHVVRLKGGDPFVFGRGAEEAMALAEAGIPFEVVPGVTTAVAAAELAGIPVTHRGIASGFVVLAGHTADTLDEAFAAVVPNSLTVVVMMAVAGRAAVAERLMARGWSADTPAAIVCGASTPDAWSWTGRLSEFGQAESPDGVAGVLIIGDVVTVRAALALRGGAGASEELADGTNQPGEAREATYGRN